MDIKPYICYFIYRLRELDDSVLLSPLCSRKQARDLVSSKQSGAVDACFCSLVYVMVKGRSIRCSVRWANGKGR